MQTCVRLSRLAALADCIERSTHRQQARKEHQGTHETRFVHNASRCTKFCISPWKQRQVPGEMHDVILRAFAHTAPFTARRGGRTGTAALRGPAPRCSTPRVPARSRAARTAATSDASTSSSTSCPSDSAITCACASAKESSCALQHVTVSGRHVEYQQSPTLHMSCQSSMGFTLVVYFVAHMSTCVPLLRHIMP